MKTIVPHIRRYAHACTKGVMARSRSLSLLIPAFLTMTSIPGAHAVELLPGTVLGWGQNVYMEATIPAEATNISALAAGEDYSLAVKNDGTVIGWGKQDVPPLSMRPPGLNNVTAVAGGKNHGVALKRDGTLVVWGDPTYSNPTFASQLKDVIAIAAGNEHTLALHRNGLVTAWGANNSNQTDVPADLTDVIAIAAGGTFSLALTKDKNVRLWGGAPSDNLAVPTDLQNVNAIAAGFRHAVALTADGRVRAWGNNTFGQTVVPTNLEGVKAIAAGAIHSWALKGDGSVVFWGGGPGTIGFPASLTGATVILSGRTHNLAANAVPLSRYYDFSDFLAPITSAPAVNLGKAGRTYPVKFQLKNPDGSLATSLSAVRSINHSAEICGRFAATPVDLLETETSGDTALRYDTVSNHFIYNWKTPSAGCYALWLTLDSGQAFPAYFNLTK